MYFLGADIAHIEAAGAAASVTLAADITAVLVALVLVEPLGGCDGQITVLQIDLDLILAEARQIQGEGIAVTGVTDIGLHQIAGVLTVKGALGIHEVLSESIVEKLIEQTLTKNAG